MIAKAQSILINSEIIANGTPTIAEALSKGVDSQKIKGSMTVVLLGHAVDMMMEMQDQHEAELKAKDERIAELEAMLQNMCAECECAKFADNAIKPSEMWKLHLALKDNK